MSYYIVAMYIFELCMSVIKLSCFNTHTTACTNDFVTMNINPSASTPTSLFQNSQNTTIRTCSVQYNIAYVIKNKYLSPMEIVHQSILIKGLYNLPCPVDQIAIQSYTLRTSDGMSTVVLNKRVDFSKLQ